MGVKETWGLLGFRVFGLLKSSRVQARGKFRGVECREKSFEESLEEFLVLTGEEVQVTGA